MEEENNEWLAKFREIQVRDKKKLKSQRRGGWGVGGLQHPHPTPSFSRRRENFTQFGRHLFYAIYSLFSEIPFPARSTRPLPPTPLDPTPRIPPTPNLAPPFSFGGGLFCK